MLQLKLDDGHEWAVVEKRKETLVNYLKMVAHNSAGEAKVIFKNSRA
jgi:hypothetical protein